jgi:lipopolysaccharide export system permease protein
MKKIDWFILKSYLGPLVMTFFISLFILLMQFVWKYIDDLVGKGLGWLIITKLMLLASSTFVPLALPLSILLSSLMMFGNLGEHYELVAMKSAGISLNRIMRSLIIVSIFISGLAFYFANVVLPVANLKFLSLLYDVRGKKLSFNIKEGVFYTGIEGYIIRVAKKDKDGSTIRDVMIYDHTKHRGNNSVTLAEWGKMELTPDNRFLVFKLYNGTNYEERIDIRNAANTHPFQRTRFKEEYQSFDLSGFQLTRTDEKLFKSNYEMLNINQLSHSIDSIKQTILQDNQSHSNAFIHNYIYYSSNDTSKIPPQKVDTAKKRINPVILANFKPNEQKVIMESAKNTATFVKESLKNNKESSYDRNKLLHKHEIVYHKKFTFSIACFLLFFIGAPLGAIIRKGGLGLPAVISTVFFIIFWILSFTGEKYSVEGVLPAYQGMWIAPAVLLPIGIFLTYKATVDASLFDIDSWIRFFTKLFRIPSRKPS